MPAAASGSPAAIRDREPGRRPEGCHPRIEDTGAVERELIPRLARRWVTREGSQDVAFEDMQVRQDRGSVAGAQELDRRVEPPEPIGRATSLSAGPRVEEQQERPEDRRRMQFLVEVQPMPDVRKPFLEPSDLDLGGPEQGLPGRHPDPEFVLLGQLAQSDRDIERDLGILPP